MKTEAEREFYRKVHAFALLEEAREHLEQAHDEAPVVPYRVMAPAFEAMRSHARAIADSLDMTFDELYEIVGYE